MPPLYIFTTIVYLYVKIHFGKLQMNKGKG